MHYLCKNMNNLSVGFSSCPNDTFIFDALVNQRIPSGFVVNPYIADVEALNEMARDGKLDITKLSYAAYPGVSENYQIITTGGALGNGCGPVLISKEAVEILEISHLKVAVPGFRTTANMLLSVFFPSLTLKEEMLFSDIEREVLEGNIPLGLIIHESRFTYEARGLLKVADLGEMWEQRFKMPIPLGCIAVRRNLPDELKGEIQRTLRSSVEYAFRHPADAMAYVQKYAAEMSPEVQKSHISLYVNQFSIDLGREGKAAVSAMFGLGQEAGLFGKITEPVFVNEII